MIYDIVGSLIYVAIAALLAAVVLQFASKIVCKQAVEYGDAWKTSVFALIGARVVDAGTAAADLGHLWPVELLAQFAIWTIVISATIGIDFLRSLAIAACRRTDPHYPHYKQTSTGTI